MQGAKKELRKAVQNALSLLSAESVTRENRFICETILNSPDYRNARHVGLYMAMPSSRINEVNLDAVVSDALANGKHCYIPRVEKDGAAMVFVRIESLADLQPNSWAILEPVPRENEFNVLKERQRLDVIYVPGLAFDADGSRLGRGKGYYDAFLAQMGGKIARKVGVGFACQLLERGTIPTSPRDVAVDQVITGPR